MKVGERVTLWDRLWEGRTGLMMDKLTDYMMAALMEQLMVWQWESLMEF